MPAIRRLSSLNGHYGGDTLTRRAVLQLIQPPNESRFPHDVPPPLFALFFVALVCARAPAGPRVVSPRSARNAAETARLKATRTLPAGEERLEQSLRALSAEAIDRNNAAFSQLVGPIRESIANVEHTVVELEKDRATSARQPREQVTRCSTPPSSCGSKPAAGLRAEGAPGPRPLGRARSCAGSSRSPGMVEHCDFVEQAVSNTRTASSAGHGGHAGRRQERRGGRQGAVRRLPRGDGGQGRPDQGGADAGHARRLVRMSTSSRPRLTGSASSRRRSRVLFVPADTFLDAALQREPNLLELAFAKNIVFGDAVHTACSAPRRSPTPGGRRRWPRTRPPCTPSGRDLYQRPSTMGGHVDKLGAALSQAVAVQRRRGSDAGPRVGERHAGSPICRSPPPTSRPPARSRLCRAPCKPPNSSTNG